MKFSFLFNVSTMYIHKYFPNQKRYLNIMVEVSLSDKHPNIYFIRYVGISSSEDDAFIYPSLETFAKSKLYFTMIIERAPDFVVIDKEFFGTTKIKKEGVYKSLTNFITFGHIGVTLSFEKAYCQQLEAIGIKTEILDNRFAYESKYKVNIKNDFQLVLSNIK
jgi:hypothetical protein